VRCVAGQDKRFAQAPKAMPKKSAQETQAASDEKVMDTTAPLDATDNPASASPRSPQHDEASTTYEGLRDFVNAASKRAQLVDVEALIRFVFPPELQHPMSTGRLLAFGMYGPLDDQARLRSGHKGSHVLQSFELDAMCHQFEREDILQVYMPHGQNPSMLNEEQQEELIAQADQRMKNARGKAFMVQIRPAEVRALFSDLEPDEDNLYNFHEMQKVVMEYRRKCIERNKVIYPNLMGGSTPKKGKKSGKATMAVGAPGDAAANTMMAKTGGRGGGGARRSKGKTFTPDVAPATMFIKDKGFNNMEIAQRTNYLLASRAFQIADFDDSNESTALTANVRLVREPTDFRDSVKNPNRWDAYCMKKGTNMGSFVKATGSLTTTKRKNTIY
jgi:hypothetical protein